MGKRLPQPADPKRVRLVLSDDELAKVERIAAEARLSVASFVRAVLVATAEEWPSHAQAVANATKRIIAAAPADRPKPGRPPKPEVPASAPKKGKWK